MIRRISELVLSDFWLKLFSLALALLLWFTIFQAIQQQGSPVSSPTEKLRERTFYNLPVTKISSSSDVSAFKLSPDEVQVTVQGSDKNVDSLQADDIKARVDLSGITGGKAPQQPIEIATPAGVTYMRVEPAKVEVICPPKAPSASK